MLILRKNIDHSLLTAGITLPIDTFEMFWQHIGKELHRGESMNINIIIDNNNYVYTILFLFYGEKNQKK